MPHWIRDANTWKAVSVPNTWIRDANTWKSGQKGWVRDSNLWKEFFDLALGVPTGFAVTGFTDASIILEWFDGSTTETQWEVFRGGSFHHNKASTSTPDVGDPYSDTQTGLAEDTTYLHKIRADDGSSVGAFTSELSKKTKLTAPSSLSITFVGDGRIDLSWTRNSSANTNVEIWSCTGSGCTGFTLHKTVGQVTSDSVTGLTNGTLYRFKVKNTKTGNDSAFSNIVEDTPVASTAPVLDTLTWDVSGAPTNCHVDVDWTDNAGDETGYEVWRVTSGAADPFVSGSNISGSLPANTVTYEDGTAAASTTYRYGVRKKGGAAGDEDSNVLQITTTMCPS